MLRKMFIAVILLLSVFSCSLQEDENGFRSNGVITGFDSRECSCCGGYFIEIQDSTYRFYDVPDGSRIDLEDPNFPINVKLDWQKDPEVCLGDEIIVLRIEEQ